MEPLSLVNSERVIAVLEDTLVKLGFLASIQPDVLAHRDELASLVGDEISHVIEDQRKLEAKYEELIALRSTLKGLVNKTRYKQNQLEIQEVSRALRESTKSLCRNLKDSPSITSNLLRIQDQRGELESLISKACSELRERRTFNTLVSYVEETRREQGRLQQVIEKEKATAAAVRELEAELDEEKKAHCKEETERTAAIAQLKEELQTIRSSLTFKTQYARREAVAKISSTAFEYDAGERELANKIESLRRIKAMEEEVHQSTVEFLTRKQEKLLEQAAEWSDRYASDMQELDSQLSELQEVRERDLARLRELEARWDAQVAADLAKQEEQRRKQDLEQLKKKELERQAIASKVIQRRYRKYRAGKPADKGKKAKGGKGSKGKKK